MQIEIRFYNALDVNNFNKVIFNNVKTIEITDAKLIIYEGQARHFFDLNQVDFIIRSAENAREE